MIPLSTEEIKNLEKITILEEGEVCAICKEDFKLEETVTSN